MQVDYGNEAMMVCVLVFLLHAHFYHQSKFRDECSEQTVVEVQKLISTWSRPFLESESSGGATRKTTVRLRVVLGSPTRTAPTLESDWRRAGCSKRRSAHPPLELLSVEFSPSFGSSGIARRAAGSGEVTCDAFST